jgi:O-antigen/teichoic acid export membrane protein
MKLIDLGTGANSQIISTSSYWRVDFVTNVVYTIFDLPLNYILISRFGLMGTAYTSVIALSFYNSMSYGFLWYRFKLQPYTFKNLLTVPLGMICTIVVYLIPENSSVIVDSLIRSFLFLILLLPVLYVLKSI